MTGFEYLSLEARVIILIHDGVKSREFVAGKLGLSRSLGGKLINSLIEKHFVVESNIFHCPHCGKKIEDLSTRLFLCLTEAGIKEYDKILKLEEIISSDNK